VVESQPRACRGHKRRRWWWLLAIVPALYVLYVAVMYRNQDAILFPGVRLHHPAAPGPADADVQQVWLTTPDGGRVEAWYQPGAGCTPTSPGPALMYFHGNFVLIDASWGIAAQSVPAGVSTLVMEYRGYGRCRGKPSQAAIVGDAARFYDWLAARPEVDAGRIVFQGTSLGGAVATALAAQRRPAALVLECTFTSVPALAYAYGLPGFLCRNPFETDRVLPTLHVPVAIFHGRFDRTIPMAHGRRLHELVPGSRFTELPCGHDNFYNDWANVRAFLVDVGVLR
jgi:fermentation-respiration switch protein FrsA (DUF1100 family)